MRPPQNAGGIQLYRASEKVCWETASMRPPQNAGGFSPVRDRVRLPIRMASMRPPQNAGGFAAACATPPWSAICFNEAPAKRGGIHGSVTKSTLFNHASMRPPQNAGGFLPAWYAANPSCLASMRPPQNAGGFCSSATGTAPTSSCFNEAPRKTRGDSGQRESREHGVDGASMRPPQNAGGFPAGRFPATP